MSNIDRFQAYADAFEETYEDDNWQRLEQYFCEDAVYAPGDGTEASGRDQVLAQLGGGINGLDRKFDARTLEADPPTQDGETVSLAWRLILSKSGAPDLTLTGVEHLTFRDGAISRMEDVFDEGTIGSLQDWMASHGHLL